MMSILIYSFKDKVHQNMQNCLTHSKKSVNLNVLLTFQQIIYTQKMK